MILGRKSNCRRRISRNGRKNGNNMPVAFQNTYFVFTSDSSALFVNDLRG